MATICLFEDQQVEGFYPLTETRHVADLLFGGMTMRERAKRLFEVSDILVHCRRRLRPRYASRLLTKFPSDSVLFLNGRAWIEPMFVNVLPESSGWIVRDGDAVVAVSLSSEQTATLDLDADRLDFSNVEGLYELEVNGWKLYNYIWELVRDNAGAIRLDGGEFTDYGNRLPDGIQSVGNAKLALGRDVILYPGVVLDRTDGPILISDGVRVMANSVIQGPCFIGPNSTVKIGAKIYHGTSIGPECKIGGEVENSIILGYSNKQHDGFLGNSYLGAWVNLGADTNTSDLKNNYGTIRVSIRGEEINTGEMFLGSLIGDHCKTGINTMLNTGTVVGIFSNIFGGGFPPKEIGPFSWCDSSEIIPYRLEKALELAARVMERRGVRLSEEERDMLTYLYRAEHGEDHP